MNKTEVDLAEGWKIAGKPVKQVVVGFFTVGDMLDAEEQPNDVARGLYLLARRIKSVGGREIAYNAKDGVRPKCPRPCAPTTRGG